LSDIGPGMSRRRRSRDRFSLLSVGLPGAALHAAWRMLRFETNPRLLPRHETGPLFMLGIPAFGSTALPVNGIGFMTAFALVGWVCALEARKPVCGALNALLYLLCIGILIVNVPVLMLVAADQPRWQFEAWLAGTMFLVTAIVAARPVIRRDFLRRHLSRELPVCRDRAPPCEGGDRRAAEAACVSVQVESGGPQSTEGVEKP